MDGVKRFTTITTNFVAVRQALLLRGLILLIHSFIYFSVVRGDASAPDIASH